MMAIRDNPMAARSMGISNPIYKAVTFGVSGLYTGIAGTLGAIVVRFVAPDSFTIYQSLALLVGLVVGGVGWLREPSSAPHSFCSFPMLRNTSRRACRGRSTA
jgi:branched-chain amino acid transport system permease protein